MTMHKLGTFVVAGLAMVIGLINSALATDSGFYLGVNVGKSIYDTDEFYPQHFDSTEFDAAVTAWTLAIGYRFTPHFGVEASYIDMGEAAATGQFHAGSSTRSADYSYKFNVSLKGPAVSIVSTLPVGNFEFSGRLGALFAHTESSRSSSYYEYPPPLYPSPVPSERSISGSSNTTEILYGIGAGYTLSDHFHFRLDWAQVSDAGEYQETGQGDVALYTAGFQYRF